MRSVGAFDAKTHFARLLDEVAEGEEITITRRGVPVARLVPVADRSKLSRDQLVEAFREFRRGRRVPAAEIREWIQEGRL